MPLCDYLSVCLCVITWQKIDQAGEPETFFNFVWPYKIATTIRKECS